MLIISELELAASTFGLVALVPQVGVRHCYSFTDNTNAMGAMRKLTPKRPVEQALSLLSTLLVKVQLLSGQVLLGTGLLMLQMLQVILEQVQRLHNSILLWCGGLVPPAILRMGEING